MILKIAKVLIHLRILSNHGNQIIVLVSYARSMSRDWDTPCSMSDVLLVTGLADECGDFVVIRRFYFVSLLEFVGCFRGSKKVVFV